MDIEQFRTHWWSSPTSAASLEADEWIEQTFTDTASFWSSLLTLQNSLSPKPVKSILGEHYDFYHDTILRHIESNPAFIYIEESGFVQTWTYKKLHRLINFQVKAWLKQSVKTGQLAVILMPVGIAYFVALLTALRLGLKICCLPSQSRFLGKNHLLNIIHQIEPSLIVTLQESSSIAKDRFPTVYLDNLGEDDLSHEPTSFAYPAHETMQLSLALYRQKPFTLVPLDAHTTYLHALRDGLVTLNLKPGVTHSTLHSCPIRSEPCCTLMTLLSGASLAHAAEEELIKDPLIMKTEKINLLEISPSQQKLWSKNPGVPKQLKALYKIPLQHHPHSWQPFVQANKLEDTPAFHLLMDNSMGGALFFSKPTTRDLDFYLKPSLGTPWSLKELNGSGEDSLKGFGLYRLSTSCQENNEVETNLILSQIEKNCIISSTHLPTREGVTIPLEKIEQVAAQLPFVESCMIHTFPKMGEAANHQLILLVFVNPMKSDIVQEIKQDWTQQISLQLNDEVGSVFIPDRIEYYPLVPKMKNGSLDRNWCIEQYSRGFLAKKKNIPLYQVLSMLKKKITLEQADAVL